MYALCKLIVCVVDLELAWSSTMTLPHCYAAEFSRSEHRIVVNNADHNAYVYDVASGELLLVRRFFYTVCILIPFRIL